MALRLSKRSRVKVGFEFLLIAFSFLNLDLWIETTQAKLECLATSQAFWPETLRATP